MNTPVIRGSIRRRLLLSLLAGAAILAFVVYIAVLSVARQVAQESQDNVLTASALSILDSARYSGGQIIVDLPYSALSMLGSVSDERVFYAIHQDAKFLSGYPDLPEAQVRSARQAGFVSAEYLGEELRIATIYRPVSMDINQSVLQVSVAQTLSRQKQALARISRSSMGVGAGVFLLLVMLAAVIARSTIRPLDRLTESVSRRGPKDLRPVIQPVPLEMGPLVISLNSFMSRLQNSLTRSEDFIAEAAHRVRTPLAIVRTKAEIIQRKNTDPQTRHAITEMIHAIDDSSRIAGQLLDHAMVTFRLDHLSREPIDLPQLAKETVERLRPMFELKGIALCTGKLDQVRLRGDPILIQNALHNLLDNAVKYAPGGARVTLDIERQPGGAELWICDTGPGFPKEDLSRLAERFRRGSNARGIVGSGLGLTIVSEILKAHGGCMKISNIEGEGGCVSLYFPFS